MTRNFFFSYALSKNIFLAMYLVLSISTNFISLNSVSANEQNSKDALELIKKFDIGTYHPEVYGLKDLIADIRFTNLDKELSNQLGQLKIDDLYFTIYWTSSGKVDVEIIGLPKGFVMVKDTLIRSVQSYIDFIIPKTFAERTKAYNLKTMSNDAGKPSKNEKVFIGTDKTHLNMIHEIKVTFDDKDRLNNLLMVTPQGTENAYYYWEKEKWGQNKWVLSSINLKSDYGIQTKIVKNDITYNTFSGIGLPIRVSVNTEVFTKNIVGNKNKKSQDSTNLNSNSPTDSIYKVQRDLIISNYRINTGEAQKYFLKKM